MRSARLFEDRKSYEKNERPAPVARAAAAAHQGLRVLPMIPFTLVPLERPFCTPDDGVYVKRSKLNTPAKLMGKMPRT
jgi:hypothetical protein